MTAERKIRSINFSYYANMSANTLEAVDTGNNTALKNDMGATTLPLQIDRATNNY